MPTDDIHQRPAELLQHLIRFDTTNPPGNELECIRYIQGLLAGAGIESQILAHAPERPNLIARLPGRGTAAPLLLYGHVDVVTTHNQAWTHPPFAGTISDGFVWGRGALDMKGGVAMMLAAFLRARQTDAPLPGDVVLAILSDEEAGGDVGARYLVDQHPEQFTGVRYALGEFGGFSMTIGGRRFYPIQVAEKQICWIKATARGPGGHGSMPPRNCAMEGLARFIAKVSRRRLPVHITPVARQMLETIAATLGGPQGRLLGQLLNPRLTDRILSLLGARGRPFDPLLHHTACPTILHGSDKINVVPAEVAVELDGRLLPGYQPDEMLRELREIAGGGIEFEVVRYDPGPPEPDMALFDTLAGILREADPMGVPVPLLLSGTTDGRFFSRLGIQSYGFLPMQLPADFAFTEVIHAADERIPATAVEFGADAIYQALQRFGSM
jgi:acetylornithine deacetylase/succinyl-diaminopimelate desuccinylase-like protein